MSDTSQRDEQAFSPLAGLMPSRLRAEAAIPPRQLAAREQSRLAKSMFSTVPIVLVGSMAMAGMGFTGPIADDEDSQPKPKAETASLGDNGTVASSVKAAMATANAAVTQPAIAVPEGEIAVASTPSTYKVKGGDTVSGIAGRYGLSTASVLALNGLGWKSVIFPGQVLKLSKASSTKAPTASTGSTSSTSSSVSRYTIRKGDTISAIAKKFGVSTQAVLSANELTWSSVIYAGRTLTIPGSGSLATTPVVSVTPIATTPTVSTVPSSYTIKSGDTISAIAKKFGVSVQSILSANSLTLSSIIYSGQKLKIASTVVTTASTGAKVTPLSAEMRANATIIVNVGQDLGVPDYGIVIALAAAMQESSLRNIDYGDRDSIGLFQQRPSTGWGTKSQLLNPTYAARLFYGGPSNPNKGVTRGLLEISGWQKLTLTQAAQKVQISAYPNAYAKWETSARAWFADLK